MTFRKADLILLLGAMVAVGCPGPKTGTYPAKGTLTIDGQPMHDVTITLLPIDGGGQKREAAGRVQHGAFEIYTGIKGIPGAMPGKYRVVLSAPSASAGAEFDEYMKAMRTPGSGEPIRKLPFPAKYLSAATSDKDVQVIAGENNLVVEITSLPDSLPETPEPETRPSVGVIQSRLTN